MTAKNLLWDFAEEIGELVEEIPTPLELSKAMELLVDKYAKIIEKELN